MMSHMSYIMSHMSYIMSHMSYIGISDSGPHGTIDALP